MLKLVIFDMDGVIFERRNFWLDLHRRMGTEKQAWQLWQGLSNSEYEHLSHRTAKIWQNRSSEHFWNLISQSKMVTDIDQIFSYLQKHKIGSAIVSSGPYQLAERAQRLFSIGSIRANKLIIAQDGTFTGEVDVQVDDSRKDISAKNIMKLYGATYETTAMIGDSSKDVVIAKLASLSIAYNTDDPALLEECKFKIKAGKISQAINLLNSYNPQ